VQSLVCAQDWLRKEPNSICVEESLEYLEKLELGEFSYCLCVVKLIYLFMLLDICLNYL